MNRKRNWMLIINSGILLFFCLYIAAALNYPGGSQANAYSTGFGWWDNYWCNLLDKNAINGTFNGARPYALAAMMVLCITLAFFWFWFPVFAGMGKSHIQIIRSAGIAAMGIALFLFTGPHDLIINAASLFGLVSVLGTLYGLFQLNWVSLLRMGIFNLLLVVINNICYYNKSLLIYLPAIQKITFLFFLLWISLITLSLSKSN